MSLQTQLATRLLLPTFRSAWRDLVTLSKGTSEDLAQQQERKLAQVLLDNASSTYGQAYRFGDLRSFAAYQAAVPVLTGDELAPWTERIAAGEATVLTSAPVTRLEPTSGSTAGKKLIPYTKQLAAEFQAALYPWLYDLYRAYPALAGGRSYWSITPVGDRPERTAGGIPIGFDDDLAYFGQVANKIMAPLFVTDDSLAKETDTERFFFRTALALLGAGDLRLMSFWNPSLLTRLLDYMRSEARSLNRSLPRARRQAYQAALTYDNWREVWPFLTVLSCWSDAGAAAEAKQVHACFPGTTLQPKGLLSTEAFFSIPWEQTPGDPVLAACSHVYEFQATDDDSWHPAHALEVGRVYRILVTTGGGLYRYSTGDLIEVTGHLGPLPRFRLLGRGDLSTDLHGEKLTEGFVLGIYPQLATLSAEAHHILIPASDRTRYLLLSTAAPGRLSELARQMDEALRTSYHYDYCRRLGQLEPVEALPLAADWSTRYQDKRVAAGQRLGDIKPPVLLTDPEWTSLLTDVTNDTA